MSSLLKKSCIVCSALLALCSCKSEKPAAATDYKVMVLKCSDDTLYSDFSATIRGKSDIQVYPQISGCITKVAVEEGEHVKRGQTLFVIDQVPYKAALETASANVDITRAEMDASELDYSSKKELYSQAVISSYELEMAENSLAVSKAKLRLNEAQRVNASNNLSYTVVKSPSDGVVGTLPFKEGALVGPSITTPLTTISDNSQMFVYFSMTENRLLSLMREYGSSDKLIESTPEVYLDLSDGSRYGRPGRIKSVSGIIDPNTGAISIKASFPNADGLLHSGGSGKVIVPQHKTGIIVIPKSATYEMQDKKFAFKIEDGTAKSVQITVSGSSGENRYIVESGLEEGDTILAEGVGFVREGMKINIKN